MNKDNPVNRRLFLQTSGAVLGSVAIHSKQAMAADRMPNVVFLICDQMRGDAMGCVGNPNARTPNLDRLAKEGVLFENAYSNNPVCVPSRMSIFSGLYPHETSRLSNRSWNTPLLEFENTLAWHFQEEGYRLGWVGKNHTYQKEAWEQFDTSSIRAREPFRKYSRFVPPQWHSDTYWPEELCHPRRNTDEAVEFIQTSKENQPFFLHVSYFDPHPPYMAPAEYTSKYCSDEMVLPPDVPPARLSSRLDTYARCMELDRLNEADFTETLRYYHASVEWGVDAQVGRILHALEEKGIRDNTIIVFTADHGDFMGNYRMVRKGMFLYDALLHVPMIWSAPEKIVRNLSVPNLVQGIDIFPTLLDLCGISQPERLSGRSLTSILKGDIGDLEKETIFTSAGYGEVKPVNNPSIDLSDEDDTPIHTRVMEQGMEPTYRTKMIRTQDWKLILNENDPPELYDRKGGGKERENVAERNEYAAIRNDLERRLKNWWPW